jgi:multiple sugar transport system ATP-binding protein
LAFGLRNKKVPEDRIRQEIDRAAGILGIGELMKRRPRQLSGGQQQRVALGRCIVRNPKVFLFDEPLSNLDAKLRTQMRIEIKRLRARIPTTSVFVTHDQVEAMTLGDRVVVMKDGRIQQVGTPIEVYARPANRFVASFIGAPAMNFFEGRIVTDADCLFVQMAALRLPLEPASYPALSAYSGQAVVVGIRPEHLAVVEERAGTIPAIVDVIEQLGSEIVLEARAGEVPLTVARVDATAPLKHGDPVFLAVKPQHLHFFDCASEAALR